MAVPLAAQMVPGTYKMVDVVEVFATDVDAAVTAAGAVMSDGKLANAFTPVLAVVKFALVEGNTPLLLFAHSLTAAAKLEMACLR